MQRVTTLLVLVATGLLPCTLFASSDTTKVLMSPLATLGKLALALLVVLSVFWVFARVMRKVHGFQGSAQQGLKVISSIALGQRERIVVVQAGEKQLVLGVTSSQINTLHVLEQSIELNDESSETDFKNKLSFAMRKQRS